LSERSETTTRWMLHGLAQLHQARRAAQMTRLESLGHAASICTAMWLPTGYEGEWRRVGTLRERGPRGRDIYYLLLYGQSKAAGSRLAVW